MWGEKKWQYTVSFFFMFLAHQIKQPFSIFYELLKPIRLKKKTLKKIWILSFEIGRWIRWAYCNFDRDKRQNDIIGKFFISTTDEKYAKHHFLFTSYKVQRIWEPIITNRGVNKQYFSVGRGIHKLHFIRWKGYIII